MVEECDIGPLVPLDPLDGGRSALSDCGSRCARTLGCEFWRLDDTRRCCLRRDVPLERTGRHEGIVQRPCTHGCLALGQPSVSNASIDDVPWLSVLQKLRAPVEPPAEGFGGDRPPPTVAVCLAGQARSLVDPAVWHSIRDLLLERGRHPLFMVLGTSAETSKLQHADLGAPDACALQHALSGLRPRRVRFVLREQPHSCANPATGQFAKWADCVRLLGEDEAAGGGAADLPPISPDLLLSRPISAS